MELNFYIFFGPFFKMDITALAASNPLFLELVLLDLSMACFLLKAVIMQFQIGLLLDIDKFIIASNEDLQIKLKWGVFPFITQPRAIKA